MKNFIVTAECKCGREVEIEIDPKNIDYQPEEPRVINPPEFADPGCPESAEYTGDESAICECGELVEPDAGKIEDRYLELMHD